MQKENTGYETSLWSCQGYLLQIRKEPNHWFFMESFISNYMDINTTLPSENYSTSKTAPVRSVHCQ